MSDGVAVKTPEELVPPDDSGARAFSGFQYQAYMAVPFCVDAGLGGPIEAVILEHFEDVAIKLQRRWRFLQIKTRDQWLNGWRLSDLIGDSGGLRSLARSYVALGDDVDASYELLLEGPADPSNDIMTLIRRRGGEDTDLVRRICERLGLTEDQCKGLLSRLHVHTAQPARSAIEAHNERLLGEKAGHLTVEEIRGIHKSIIDLVIQAMNADRLGDRWPVAILDPDAEPEPSKARLFAKTITRARLEPLVAALGTSPRILLGRAIETPGERATILEEKLVAGGATASVISDAQSLRAKASFYEARSFSASLIDSEDRLEDVRERLRLLTNAVRDKHSAAVQPAVEIWHELMTLLPSQSAALDSSGFFSRDPMLLLGEVCQLADLCLTDWGLANA